MRFNIVLSTVSLCVVSAFCAPKAADANQDTLANVLRSRILPQSDEFNSWNSIFKTFAEADRKADEAWGLLDSQKEYDAHRREMRKRLIESIGGLEIEKTPLNAKTVTMIPCAGYRIEKVIFESSPGVYVTSLLFLPDAAKYNPPYHGILLACGHSYSGKGMDGYQRGAVLGAEAGFAVLIVDPVAQGEREQVPGGFLCDSHNHYGSLAALLGQNMLRQRLWDGIRAIDYLMTRDDVRKDGVGCMGNSGGGTVTSFLMAVDPRIVCAAPSCYLSSLRETARNVGAQDAEQNVFNQLGFGLNHAGLALLGGNAVRIHASFEDFFPVAGTYSTYALVTNVAKKCGIDAKCYGITDVPGRHGWKESTRVSSIQWMQRWLAGDRSLPEIDVSALRKLDVGFDIKKVDAGLNGKANNVTPKGAVKHLPGFKSIYDYLKDDLARAESLRRNPGRRVSAEVVCRRANIRKLENISFQVETNLFDVSLPDCSKVIRQVYVFYDGNKVPALTFMPSGGVKGAVLIVDDRADRAIHRVLVQQNLKQGNAVMVADLAGVGETGAVKHRFYSNESSDEPLSLLYYMLGRSLVGVRAEEMMVLADFLKKLTGRKVEALAHGRQCIPAAHAFVAGGDLFSNVVCMLAPESWASSIRQSAYVPYANVVNGALLDYDWTDLLENKKLGF